MASGDKLTLKVDMVIRLIDGLDRSFISGSGMRFYIDGQSAQPVFKPEGYYVFYNLQSRVVDLTVEMPGYYGEGRVIDLDSLDRLSPVVPVELRPSREHALPPGALRLELTVSSGKKAPVEGFEVFVVPIVSRSKIKYSKTGVKNIIRLFDPSGIVARGAHYGINNYDTGRVSVFRVEEILDDGRYRITGNTEGFENGDFVTPIRSGKSGKDGELYIPLIKQGFEERYVIYYMNGRKEVLQEIDFGSEGRYGGSITIWRPKGKQGKE